MCKIGDIVDKFIIMFDLFVDFNEGTSRLDVSCGKASLENVVGLDAPMIFDKLEINVNVTSRLALINQSLAIDLAELKRLDYDTLYSLVSTYEENLKEAVQDLVDTSYAENESNLMDFQQELIKEMVREVDKDFHVMDIVDVITEEYKEQIAKDVLNKIQEMLD